MRRTPNVWASILAGIIIASAVWAVPQQLKEVRLQYLLPAEGIRLLCATKEPYISGGSILVKRETAEPTGLTAENAATVFRKITNVKQAEELCQLLVWGTLISSEKDFEELMGLYRKSGFQLTEAAGQKSETAECMLYEVKRKFGQIARESESGFEVEFTAFIMQRGMGAAADVEQLRYQVAKDGSVKMLSRVVYLKGPWLNWQTANLSAEEEKQDAAKYAKRQELIQQIYKVCPELLPAFRRRTQAAESLLGNLRAQLPQGWICTAIEQQGKMGHPHGLGEPLFRADFANTNLTFPTLWKKEDPQALHPALQLYFYDLAAKSPVMKVVEQERNYSWNIPIYFGETKDFLVVTSPAYVNHGIFTEEAKAALRPLWETVRKCIENKEDQQVEQLIRPNK